MMSDPTTDDMLIEYVQKFELLSLVRKHALIGNIYRRNMFYNLSVKLQKEVDELENKIEANNG